jgi:hypothetical protein
MFIFKVSGIKSAEGHTDEPQNNPCLQIMPTDPAITRLEGTQPIIDDLKPRLKKTEQSFRNVSRELSKAVDITQPSRNTVETLVGLPATLVR